jgi:prevent-host-death family protein
MKKARISVIIGASHPRWKLSSLFLNVLSQWSSQIDQSCLIATMREIQASDAKACLLQLLDDVEGGETVIIMRHGRAIARIVPETGRWQKEIGKAVDGMKAIRKRNVKVTLDELLAARHEGYKY